MPVGIFVDREQNLTVLYLVMDERMFSDTVLRVIRVSSTRFLVYDIRYLNGIDVYTTFSFDQRKTRLQELLNMFHQPDLIALQLPEDVLSHEFPVRGHEYFDDQPGTIGVFLPVKE